MTTAKEDSPLPQRLDAQRTQDLLRALQELSHAHGLGIDTAALAAARQPLAPQDDQYTEACLHLQALFPRRTAAHTQELGEAPQGAYPRLLAGYAVASGGDFVPLSIEADYDDGWDTLTLEFQLGGKAQRFKVSGVADSDWFTADFLKALNRFARRAGLPGRWVDFQQLGSEDAAAPARAIRRLVGTGQTERSRPVTWNRAGYGGGREPMPCPPWLPSTHPPAFLHPTRPVRP